MTERVSDKSSNNKNNDKELQSIFREIQKAALLENKSLTTKVLSGLLTLIIFYLTNTLW